MNYLSSLFLAAVSGPTKIDPNGIVPNGTTTVGGGLTEIINLMITLVGSLAVIFVIYGGLLMVLSAGNPARIKSARETIIYAMIGLVVSIGAYAIVNFVTGRFH